MYSFSLKYGPNISLFSLKSGFDKCTVALPSSGNALNCVHNISVEQKSVGERVKLKAD